MFRRNVVLVFAAVTLSYAILIPGLRWVRTVQVLHAPDVKIEGEGVFRAEPVTLRPGRHRARVTYGRLDPRPSDPSPHADVRGGFDRVPRSFSFTSYVVRWLDLAASRERTFHFPFRIEESATYRWNFLSEHDPPRLTVLSTRVTAEDALWEVRGARARTPLRNMIANALLAIFVTALGIWAIFPKRQKWATDSLVRKLWVGVATFFAGGLALWTMATTATRWAGESTIGERWVFLPGLGNPLAGIHTLVLLGLLIGAIVMISLACSVDRRFLWVLPVSALGLLYADTVTTPQNDWNGYYTAGLAVWSGVNPYHLHPSGFMNPPPFLALCVWLPLLPITFGAFVWFGIKSAATAALVPLARRCLLPAGEDQDRPWWKRPEWIGGLVCLQLLATDMYWGNMNNLVLALLLLTAVLWSLKKVRKALWPGVLAAWLKATPGFQAIAIAMTGRIRWAIAALTLIGVGLLASMATLEWRVPSAGVGFLEDVTVRQRGFEPNVVGNQSLRGASQRFLGDGSVRTNTIDRVVSAELGSTVADAVWGGLVLLVLALVFVLARRAADSGRPSDRTEAWCRFWAGSTLAIVLLSPVSWVIHFVVLYPAAVVLARLALDGNRPAWFGLGAVALVIHAPVFFRLANDLFFAYSALPLISLFVLVLLVTIPRDSSYSTPAS